VLEHIYKCASVSFLYKKTFLNVRTWNTPIIYNRKWPKSIPRRCLHLFGKPNKTEIPSVKQYASNPCYVVSRIANWITRSRIWNGRPKNRGSITGKHKKFWLSRLALGPTQPSIQWVLGSLASGIRRTGREFYHSPPSGAEVKNEWSYTSAPSIRLCIWTNLLALYWSLSSTTITTTTTHKHLLRYHWYSINPALYGENFDFIG